MVEGVPGNAAHEEARAPALAAARAEGGDLTANGGGQRIQHGQTQVRIAGAGFGLAAQGGEIGLFGAAVMRDHFFQIAPAAARAGAQAFALRGCHRPVESLPGGMKEGTHALQFGRVHGQFVTRQGPVEVGLKATAITMLVFIGISIAAAIVIQIAFHILYSVELAVREKMHNQACDDEEIGESVKRTIGAEMVDDEMNKQVELKASRAMAAVSGAGFLAGLAALALGYAPTAMLNIQFAACYLGWIAEGCAQIYYYRKGI